MLCLASSSGVNAKPNSCWVFIVAANGSLPMCSTPPPITTSWTPTAIWEAARFTACCAEPHWRSIVVAEVSIGKPCCSHALRPTCRPWGPNCATQPAITFSTSAGIDPGALDHRAVGRAEQLVRVRVLVVALLGVSAPDRGAGGLDDHYLTAFNRHSAPCLQWAPDFVVGGAPNRIHLLLYPGDPGRTAVAPAHRRSCLRNDWESPGRARSPAASPRPPPGTARCCCGRARERSERARHATIVAQAVREAARRRGRARPRQDRARPRRAATRRRSSSRRWSSSTS